MLDSVDYSEKKGIYRDLYRAINFENQKSEQFEDNRPRKGIYRDIYRNIESNNNTTGANICLKSFGKGFVSSLESMFETPKDFIISLGLIFVEWALSKKKQLHIFSKLGKIAGIAQLIISINEWRNNKNSANASFFTGSGISSLGFSHKYAGLLNYFSLIKTLNKGVKDTNGR